MNVKELTNAEFRIKVLDYENSTEWNFLGDKPAVIDFYATWCGPCKATAPVLEEVATENIGKLDVYKVDIDKEPELAALFNVRSIPTLLFIPKTGQPSLQVGAMNKSQLTQVVNSELLKG
uniref:Thioredoxin n=1 Tax=Prevotella sp. GTC17259 TaxID=3236795 RepID=A0AB33J014_9BACT